MNVEPILLSFYFVFKIPPFLDFILKCNGFIISVWLPVYSLTIYK